MTDKTARLFHDRTGRLRHQEEIAAILGITKSSWAMYERDERVPRDEVKIRIANFFGKTVQELFYTPIEHYKCS